MTNFKNSYFTGQNFSILLIVILHAVGILGLLSSYQDVFILLTPLHLLITLVIVLFHYPKNKLITITTVAILAWILEFIGVNTGFPFGEYTYGQTLGWKIAGTPLLIAANWLILLLTSNSLIKKLNLNFFWTSLVSALAMTSLDFFIEPVAIQLDFWWWSEARIPWNNYLAWFVASFLFSLLLNIKTATRTFSSLNVLFCTQVVFFVALYLFL